MVQKPPKQVLLSPESLSMAGLWIQFGPSDVCLGVAERTLEGGEANGGLRDKPFQKAQKAGKLKQADRDSRRPGGFGPTVEEVDSDHLFLALFDTTTLWVGLCSRGESYRKVPVYIDFKCYSQK